MTNENVRIKDINMTNEEVIFAMCDGNRGAITAMMQMLQRDNGILQILQLDMLGIYGSKLYMLWNDCCGRDMDKLDKTIKAFSRGQFSREEIHANLDQVRAKPFI